MKSIMLSPAWVLPDKVVACHSPSLSSLISSPLCTLHHYFKVTKCLKGITVVDIITVQGILWLCDLIYNLQGFFFLIFAIFYSTTYIMCARIAWTDLHSLLIKIQPGTALRVIRVEPESRQEAGTEPAEDWANAGRALDVSHRQQTPSLACWDDCGDGSKAAFPFLPHI